MKYKIVRKLSKRKMPHETKPYEFTISNGSLIGWHFNEQRTIRDFVYAYESKSPQITPGRCLTFPFREFCVTLLLLISRETSCLVQVANPRPGCLIVPFTYATAPRMQPVTWVEHASTMLWDLIVNFKRFRDINNKCDWFRSDTHSRHEPKRMANWNDHNRDSFSSISIGNFNSSSSSFVLSGNLTYQIIIYHKYLKFRSIKS